MNFIAFRNPGQTKPYIYEAGEASAVDFKNKNEGFVVAPFDPAREGRFYSFGRALDSIPEEEISLNDTGAVFEEKTENQHKEYIGRIIEILDGSDDRKIVASRRQTFPLTKGLNQLFHNLCVAYPDAFVFLISTKEFGTWIGATPELLLRKDGPRLETMALAGTRTTGESEPWDAKNSMEQEIVTAHISSLFGKFGIMCRIGERSTRRAGPIEHLMTPVEGYCVNEIDLPSFLKEFSPTPALAGFPKEEAIRVIRENEGDRILYGGYCGPVDKEGNFSLNVILRCGYVNGSGNGITLFGGGGITAFSDPGLEYRETVNKISTLRKFL